MVLDLIFELGSIENSPEIVSVFEEAINHMIKAGIHQWDAIYPNKKDIENDLQKKEMYIGTINREIAVVFVLNQIHDKQYENATWSPHTERFMVLHRLCVHPTFQNMGIARKTMQYIENKLHSQGISAIRLDAFSLNPYALQLYTSLGFKTVGEAQFRKGTFFLMEKLLTDL